MGPTSKIHTIIFLLVCYVIKCKNCRPPPPCETAQDNANYYCFTLLHWFSISPFWKYEKTTRFGSKPHGVVLRFPLQIKSRKSKICERYISTPLPHNISLPFLPVSAVQFIFSDLSEVGSAVDAIAGLTAAAIDTAPQWVMDPLKMRVIDWHSDAWVRKNTRQSNCNFLSSTHISIQSSISDNSLSIFFIMPTFNRIID